MQSHLMNKRRSEVSVAPLRPLALNRATSEILPYRGTLFLKVIKGTQLVQAPKLPLQRESKLGARLSAFLGDGRVEAGAVMHAVSVTSWLTDEEPEVPTPGVGEGDSLESTRSIAGESNAGPFTLPSPQEDGFGPPRSGSPIAAAAAAGLGAHGGGGSRSQGGAGGVLRRIPKPDAARTSTKFISDVDAEGGASWDEEFFFGRVSGEIAVRIVCNDKPLRQGAEDEVVGELLIPVSRLPQNEPVEQWYGLEPPVGSGKTFTKAALLLRFLFTTSASPDAAAATAAAGSGAAKAASGGGGGRRQSTLSLMNEEDGVPGVGSDGGGGGMAEAREAAAGYHGAEHSGLGAEEFRQALLMAGVTPGGGGGGGGGSHAAAAAAAKEARLKEAGAKRGDKFSVNLSIDPFGEDEIEDDGSHGGGGGGGAHREDAQAQKGDLALLRTQQLQLGTWGNPNAGTAVHAGATAAEAALALSTDEILPAGLVDYFLVVGPAVDEEGKLRVADYANCGFGSSSSAPAAAGSGSGGGELPATAVEVESAVLEHFPEEQREDAPFPTKVEWFCFPQGLFLLSAVSQPAPHVSSFVRFTSGVRSYGLCLTFYRQVDVLEGTSPFAAGSAASRGGRVSGYGSESDGQGAAPRRRGRLWCPLCLCVLTHIPVLEGLMHWLRMFYWCLVKLEGERDGGERKRGTRRPTELDAAVFQLTLEVPLPVPGVCAMSIRAFGERFWTCPEPEFTLPGIRELPALSFPLALLLRSLRPKGVLQLFAAILQEGRILLHSTKPALLAAVAEGVFALMYPLQWPYAYVPVLPNCLIEHVESPQPFILGVHTGWLSDIAPDALAELIIVDCDLGSVDGPAIEQLPPPVRRSLTKAVRAVLHVDLGNLDAPMRLSKPGVAVASSAALRQGLASSSCQNGGSPVRDTCGSLNRTVGAVGMSAWTDRDRRSVVAAPIREGVRQGGGEKSAEAGDYSSRGSEERDGGGGVVVRKARRGRARGAAARLEALLRLEFARAMADMLYGFTECLFFLHPDRPIFNGARFLQEYCEESYVPFMSVVIDTLAFKYLLETQDSTPLRPFHDMLDKARREAFKRGGDHRHQLALGTQRPAEPSAPGPFDGPFPVVNGFDELVVSRPKTSDAATTGVDSEAGAAAAAARMVVVAPPPPPAFAIESPSLRSFGWRGGSGEDDGRDEDEVDFNASRGKEDVGVGGGIASGVEGGEFSDGAAGSGAQEMEQAAEEVREQESLAPPPPTSSNGATAAAATMPRGEGDRGSKEDGQEPLMPAIGIKMRAKREERSGLKLSDARGGFIGGSVAKGATRRSHDRNSMEEADEMSDEGGRDGNGGARIPPRRGPGLSFDLNRRGRDNDGVCYDSAGDWASDASDGLPAVIVVRKKTVEKDAAGVGGAGTGAAGGQERLSRTSLSTGSPRRKSADANIGQGRERKALSSTAPAVARAGQSAGESALEEEHPQLSELTVGEGTAPPTTASSSSLRGIEGQAGQEGEKGGVSRGRAAALVAAFEKRRQFGASGGREIERGAGDRGMGGGGGIGSGPSTVRERVAALSARGGGGGGGGGAGGGGGSVMDKVRIFSGSEKLRGDRGADDDPPPPGRPSLNFCVSSSTTVDEDDTVPHIGERSPMMSPPAPPKAGEVFPSSPPPTYAAVVTGTGGRKKAASMTIAAGMGPTEGASKKAAAPAPAAAVVAAPSAAAAELVVATAAVGAVSKAAPEAAPVAPASGRSRRGEGLPPVGPLPLSSEVGAGTRSKDGGGGVSESVGGAAPPHRDSYDGYDGAYEPVLAPLSMVDWSHEPLLALGDCDLPQPREWTLADIGKEIEEDLGEALQAQTEGSANAGLGHGAYSLKAGAGLAAAAGAGDGEELDRDSEKLLQCLEAVYSSDRVSEEVVMDVEDTLRTKPAVQQMFLQVLRHASQRGYASSRGPTLLHGPSFETLARFSYTLLCVCVDRVDYSVAHTLLQLTGNYFQVHEGAGEVFRGERIGPGAPGGEGGGGLDGVSGGEGEQPGFFSEFLSARICRHHIFTDMKFWQHVLREAVLAKTEKIAKGRHTIASARRTGAGHARDDGGGDSSLSSPGSPDEGVAASNLLGKNPGRKNDERTEAEREANRALQFKDPALASEIVCRQVKVFLYEMASIGMRAKTAQRYVEAVSLQYKLEPAARDRLSETVRLVWGAVASMAGPGSPPLGSKLTPEMSAAQEGWSQARMDAAADADLAVAARAAPHAASSRSAASSLSSGGGGGASSVTTARNSATPNSGGGVSSGGGGGRPNSASSAFSAGTGAAAGMAGAAATTNRLPALRLSASELVNQLQAESSPSPRVPTTPASGSRGRFRSSGNKNMSSTFSPSRSGGGGSGSGITTPSSISPQRRNIRSRGESPGAGPAGGAPEESPPERSGAVQAGTWHAGSTSSGGGGGGGDRGRWGGIEAELTPRRPLVRARAGKEPAGVAAEGKRSLEEAEEAPMSPGPSGGATGAGPGLARRFFFGGTETVRSLASSLSPPQPPEKSKVGAAAAVGAAEPSTLPSSPQGPPPPLGLTESVSNSGSVGSEGTGWAETVSVSGGKGELPSLLAPVELHGRDNEGATHHGPILCLAAFESRACAGSTDGTVSVYDLSAVSRVGVLSGHTGPVTTLACGDDWVLSGSTDSSLRLWQNGGDNAISTTPPRRGFIPLGWQAPANTGTFKAKLMAGHQGSITAVSAHPRRVDGKPWLAVSGGEDSQIRMWDLRTRRCKVIFTGHSEAITCLTALREDGSSLILSGAKDCTVRLWDINEASGCKALRKFSGHEGAIGTVLKIGPFAAVSCSNDRTLRTWDHRVKGSVGVLRGHTGPVTCVQQMPANRSVVASGSADGTVMMWDVRATAKGPLYTLRGHTDRVTGLLASGKSVYSCSEDASMREWDWETGQLKTKFIGNRGKTAGAAARGISGGNNAGISCLAGTGSAVLTAGWDTSVTMWPRSSPAPQSEEAVAAAAAAAAASALAAGGRRR